MLLPVSQSTRPSPQVTNCLSPPPTAWTRSSGQPGRSETPEKRNTSWTTSSTAPPPRRWQCWTLPPRRRSDLTDFHLSPPPATTSAWWRTSNCTVRVDRALVNIEPGRVQSAEYLIHIYVSLYCITPVTSHNNIINKCYSSHTKFSS